MINEKTGILEIPYNLVTLSKATGNPMIDLGYQCSDMRPFFKYQNGSTIYYTTVNPKNGILQEINVYTKYSRNVNGVIQDAMMYQGYTSATTASTITYNGVVYSYTNTYENIRMHYINMWSRYKPVDSSKITELTPEEFQSHSYGVSAQPSPYGYESKAYSQAMLEDLKAGNFYWIYTPPQPNGIDYFRMTDFIGYYSKAQSPFYLYLREFDASRSHKDNDGYDIIYVDNKYDSSVDLNVKIGSEPTKGPTNPSLNWHDVISVFGNNSDTIIDYTDPNEMENIAEFYQDKGYGLVYYNGKDYGWTPRTWDDTGLEASQIPPGKKGKMRYPVCEYVPADPSEGKSASLQQEVTIPLSVKVGGTVEVGGVIFNGGHGGNPYYFPAEPLKFKVKKVPDLIKPSYKFYADGTAFCVDMTVQRNGFEWYWSVYNDAPITGIHIQQSDWSGDGTYTANNGYLRVQPYIKNSIGEIVPETKVDFYDSVLDRECYVRSEKIEGWNGWIKPDTQAEVNTPKFEISALTGIDSAIIKLRIPEFTKLANNLIWNKDGNDWMPGIVRVDTTVKFVVYINESVTFGQLIKFDLGDKEIFNGLGPEDKGWPNISNNND